MATYGCREYEDALLELKETVESRSARLWLSNVTQLM